MPAEPFIAHIMPAGFNFAPRNWATCDGQILPISQNTALFSLLGTMYGGNGQSNFALPNLQDSVALGWDHSSGAHYLGEIGGQLSVTLTTPEIPSHGHSAPATTATGRGRVALNGVPAASMSGASTYAPHMGALQALAPGSGGVTGVGLPHNNLQPYATVLFCIALQGVFPARN